MTKWTIFMASIALMTGRVAHSDVLVVDHEAWVDSHLLRASSTTDTLTDLGSAPFFPTTADLQPSHDGFIYFATSAGYTSFVRARLNMSDVEVVAPIQDSSDMALDASGTLLVLDRWSITNPETGIFEVEFGGSTRVLDSIPGFAMMGFDVPHAGPFRDGLLVIGFTLDASRAYFLYRYRRLPDGRLEREGPFGPIEASPWLACASDAGFLQTHVAARADGLTFLTVEGCSERILEHDLDGQFVRTFANPEDDPTIPDPLNPAIIYDDHVTAVHVTPEDDIYVATRKRLRRYAGDGTLIAVIPHVFRLAYCLGDVEPAPFERDDSSCRVSGIGYWKRQCLTREIGFARRPTRSHPTLGTGPALHPTFRDGRLGELLDRVTRDLDPYGVTACEALWPADPSSWRSKALTRLASIYLDIEDGRLGLDCETTVDAETMTVRRALRDIGTEMDRGTPESERAAAAMAHDIAGGVR